MGNTVNPDGGRIRALRIQRGWTQEQLAEIAGVSPRTIQRAEAADRASFDTVRAVAGAFGEGFDDLLKTQDCNPPMQNSECSPPSRAATPAPRVTPPAARSDWRPVWLAVPALSLGILVGAVLMRHPGTEGPKAGKPSTSGLASDTVAAGGGEQLAPPASRGGSQPAATTPAEPKAALSTAKLDNHRRAVPRGEADRTKVPSRAIGGAQTHADLAQTVIRDQDGTQLGFIALESRQAGPGRFVLLSAAPVGSLEATAASPGEPVDGPGAVRQAMSHAGKRTGVFFAKFGASMRRAF